MPLRPILQIFFDKAKPESRESSCCWSRVLPLLKRIWNNGKRNIFVPSIDRTRFSSSTENPSRFVATSKGSMIPLLFTSIARSSDWSSTDGFVWSITRRKASYAPKCTYFLISLYIWLSLLFYMNIINLLPIGAKGFGWFRRKLKIKILPFFMCIFFKISLNWHLKSIAKNCWQDFTVLVDTLERFNDLKILIRSSIIYTFQNSNYILVKLAHSQLIK